MSEQKAEYKIDGRPSTIFRVVHCKDNPYVVIDKRPIENPMLSFKAKGILVYLMSRPDGWEVSVSDLMKRSTDKEWSVRSGLKELRDAGHMRYTTSRDQGRITGWLIEIYEVPQDMPYQDNPTDEILDEGQAPDMGVATSRFPISGDQPDRGFPQVENPQVGNQGQVLSTLSNKELNNIKDNKQLPEILAFTDHFGHFNGKREEGRWITLFQAIGACRAEEIAAWAERQEIHMTNRGRLMDSLETAAKKWTDPPSGPKYSKESFAERVMRS